MWISICMDYHHFVLGFFVNYPFISHSKWHESLQGVFIDYIFLNRIPLFSNVATLSSSDSAYSSLLAKTTCHDILIQNSHNSFQDLNDNLYF